MNIRLLYLLVACFINASCVQATESRFAIEGQFNSDSSTKSGFVIAHGELMLFESQYDAESYIERDAPCVSLIFKDHPDTSYANYDKKSVTVTYTELDIVNLENEGYGFTRVLVFNGTMVPNFCGLGTIGIIEAIEVE